MIFDGWDFEWSMLKENVSLEDTDYPKWWMATREDNGRAGTVIHSLVIFDGTLVGLLTAEVQNIYRAVLFIGDSITIDGCVEKNVFKVHKTEFIVRDALARPACHDVRNVYVPRI